MTRLVRRLAAVAAAGALSQVIAGVVLARGAGFIEDQDPGGQHVWSGSWQAPAAGFYEFSLLTPQSGRIVIDGTVVQRQAAGQFAENPRILWIDRGPHDLIVEAVVADPAVVPLSWSKHGDGPRPASQLDVLRRPPTLPRLRSWLVASRGIAWWLTIGSLVGLMVVGAKKLLTRAATAAWIQALTKAPIPWKRAATVTAVTLVVAYGALLRFDALTLKYGPVASPGWLRGLQEMRGPDSALRPAGMTWERHEGRYTSDPYTYLIYARDMRHFYGASLREPVFPFVTRVYLWLFDNQDVAVSMASATFSLLAVLATYVLGARAFARWVGLVAAALLAIEYDVISQGVSGWRDDAFLYAVVLTAWTLVRYVQRPTPRAAVLIGVVGGLACLVRITSLLFVIPAIGFVLLRRGSDRRHRLLAAALAALTTATIVAPFLVACWREYGDPLYAINAHATVYRQAVGETVVVPQSALEYLGGQWARRPVAMLETFARGMTTYPFLNKWNGFSPWAAWLGPVLAQASVVGLILMAATGAGRLLLVLLAASLVPYSMTWRIGADWRFTEHAYPFFLIAGPAAVYLAVRAWRTFGAAPPRLVVAFGFGAWLVAIACGAWSVGRWLPWYKAAEDLRNGEDVTFPAGPGGSAFVGRGWSPVLTSGNVTSRVSRGDSSEFSFPLPGVRDYGVTLRFDPFPRPLPDAARMPAEVTVDVNGRRLRSLSIEFSPERVGAYDLTLPANMVRAGTNTLRLSTSTGAIALWYVRVRSSDRRP